jgi:hypothetical protein
MPSGAGEHPCRSSGLPRVNVSPRGHLHDQVEGIIAPGTCLPDLFCEFGSPSGPGSSIGNSPSHRIARRPPGWRVNLMRQSLGQAGGQVLAHTPRDYCEIVAKLFERFSAVPPLFDPEPGPEIMVSESADGVQSVGIETCYGLYISQWELLKRLLCKAARLGIRNRANADMVTQHLVALGSVLGWRSPDLVLAGSFGVAAARLLSRQRLWNGCGPTGATR